MPADTPNRSGSLVRLLRTVLGPVASLKITVGLFILAGLLVFFGTLAQKGQGVWTVVDSYFYSWWVKVELKYLLEFGKVFLNVHPDATTATWVPFPAGKLLGWAMVVNLTAAHILQLVNLIDGVKKEASRTRSTAADVTLTLLKRAGIYILHGGVLLLLIGEYVTREWQVEQQMTIDEGGASNLTVDTKQFELAFVDGSGVTEDKVTVVPLAKLIQAHRAGTRLTHPDLPADLEVLREYKNTRPIQAGEMEDNLATAGEGTRVGVRRAEEVAGVDMTKEVDIPAVYVRLLRKGTDEAVGVYLMTLWAEDQPIRLGDTTYTVSLRRTHYYKPYTIHLNDFRFDRYVGTETAKNYSSDVRLEDPAENQNRDVTIRMNEPLRHRGDALFQADFDKRTETTTILQVVSNPGWQIPYWSCCLVVLGMGVHFVIKLVQFLARSMKGVKSAAATTPTATAPGTIDLTARTLSPFAKYGVPAVSAAVAVLVLVVCGTPRAPTKDRLNLQKLATLPVVDGGRVKPLDTVARVNLRQITHAEEFGDGKGRRQALEWFLDTAVSGMDQKDGIAAVPLFRIENDEVRDAIKLKKREGMRYSWAELMEQVDVVQEESGKAARVPEKKRTLYQSKMLELAGHMESYQKVVAGVAPLTLPPDAAAGTDWRSPVDAEKAARDRAIMKAREQLTAAGLPTTQEGLAALEDPAKQRQVMDIVTGARAAERQADPPLAAWGKILLAYSENDPKAFDAAVTEYRKIVADKVPAGDSARADLEVFLNQSSLYYWCTGLYVAAGVGSLIGFVLLLLAPKASQTLRRGVFWWLVVTFVVHTFTLLTRMYLMDRPLVFVTNLYSSAVFIGWGVVALCLILELVYPIGFGNLVASGLGFATTVIAHNLATSGDTLEMMQAVLDTNFWLATHVTTVTLGYAATYVAGVLGLLYVLLYVLPEKTVLRQRVVIGSGLHQLTYDIGKILGTLTYSVVCFATLLSFVGTVLGGIWADQSWGRFWGWDPKENGAVLIVLWNALILHARWGGLVKERGLAVLSVVGIMVTTWSWFGTNQLGVGLHAYGFSNQLVRLCDGVWIGSLLAILVGVLPWQWVYRGGEAAPPPQATRVG